jgi:hypothetical protein
VFFAQRGITVTTVGMFGGMTYENAAIHGWKQDDSASTQAAIALLIALIPFRDARSFPYEPRLKW